MKRGVTIGIPAYNARKTLERAIDSALSQTLNVAYEIIIVDDGSNDNTANIALSYELMFPDIIRLIRVPNRGVAAARNIVVANAKYDHLTWLDADDYYKANKLRDQYDALMCSHMINHTLPGDSHVMVFSPVFIDKKIYRFSDYFEEPVRNILTGDFRAYLWASMVSTSAYLEVGKFNEELHRSEDTDWLLRYLLSGQRLLISTNPDDPVMQYHFSTQRDGKKVEESFDYMIVNYGDMMKNYGIFDEYVPRRYWEISNFYHSNKKWNEMWRCRALASKHGADEYSQKLNKEIMAIKDDRHRTDIQKLVSKFID